jgi:hypothetical protein
MVVRENLKAFSIHELEKKRHNNHLKIHKWNKDSRNIHLMYLRIPRKSWRWWKHQLWAVTPNQDGSLRKRIMEGTMLTCKWMSRTSNVNRVSSNTIQGNFHRCTCHFKKIYSGLLTITLSNDKLYSLQAAEFHRLQ